MKRFVFIAVLFFSTPALAQPVPQMQRQSTQDQLTTTYSTISMNLAKQLDAANDKIEALQRQLAEMQRAKEPAREPEQK